MPFSRPLSFLQKLLLVFMLPATLHAEVPGVAVTVKPVFSLVASLMRGVGKPDLIISSNATPHHYSLRPSERRLIANASLVIWVGPELETFMPRVFSSMEQDKAQLVLIDIAEIVRLPARSVHPEQPTRSSTNTRTRDPHIWLMPDNVRIMVDAISKRLTSLDPKNSARYEHNRQSLHKRINSTDATIRRTLSAKTSPFMTYHDAYQYFEKTYRLNNAGFVSSGPEISPSAKYVHALRERMRTEDIHCLLYEAPNRPALVDALTHDLNIRTIEVDATGIRLQANENTWFDIMLRLAKAYESCL